MHLRDKEMESMKEMLRNMDDGMSRSNVVSNLGPWRKKGKQETMRQHEKTKGKTNLFREHRFHTPKQNIGKTNLEKVKYIKNKLIISHKFDLT